MPEKPQNPIEEILPDQIPRVPISEEIKTQTLENPVLINPTIIGGTVTNATVTRYVKITSGVFGGDGTDGDLIITSGTTTLDLNGAQFFTKNYSSIEISGTGKLAFSNPHANGTFITLKSQGSVVLTSSTNPCIDASGIGGAAGANGTYILDDTNHYGVAGSGQSGGGTGGAILATKNFYTKNEFNLGSKSIFLACGSGGGNGSSGTGGSGGAGGRGGGALLIECGTDLNFTGTISVAGLVGENGTGGTNGAGGGGGGGAGGMIVILYGSATSTTGTLNNIGGNGGTGGNPTGYTSGGSGGKGGGGAGAYGGAGGTGGNGSLSNGGSTAGDNGGGTSAGAGGGGGGGCSAVSCVNGAVGGTAGASDDLLHTENKYF